MKIVKSQNLVDKKYFFFIVDQIICRWIIKSQWNRVIQMFSWRDNRRDRTSCKLSLAGNKLQAVSKLQVSHPEEWRLQSYEVL